MCYRIHFGQILFSFNGQIFSVLVFRKFSDLIFRKYSVLILQIFSVLIFRIFSFLIFRDFWFFMLLVEGLDQGSRLSSWIDSQLIIRRNPSQSLLYIQLRRFTSFLLLNVFQWIPEYYKCVSERIELHLPLNLTYKSLDLFNLMQIVQNL